MPNTSESERQKIERDLRKREDEILAIVEKPIDPELQDDKARNAMKAKKECFMDAQDILMAIHKMQNQINEGSLTESEIESEDKSFKAGFSEKYAKK